MFFHIREGVKDVQTKKASINQLFSKDKHIMFPWSKETKHIVIPISFFKNIYILLKSRKKTSDPMYLHDLKKSTEAWTRQLKRHSM